MKKVLFATTALVATASVAAADVSFGGYGRFGILYNEAAAGDETNVTSRFRLQIDATAESDGGVVFGARARIQQNNTDDNTRVTGGTATDTDNSGDIDTVTTTTAGSGPAGTGINGVRFFARFGGFEVGVGNIYGALEWMSGQYPIDLGLTGLGYDYTVYNFRGDFYSSGGNGAAGSNGVEVLYSVGDFGIHVSASDVNDRVAANVSYSFGDWTAALGVQDSDNAADTDWTVTFGGSIGAAFVNLAWADNGTAGDHWAIAGRFDVNSSTNIEAYVADADYFAETSYGIDFNHDLGGGTSLRGGVAHRGSGDIRADLGVRFNF
jgi:outer membrane protein OmpU